MSSRIKTGFALGEPMPANMPADFDWLKANHDQLLEKFGSCVVVIYEKQVLGVGENYTDAIANAEKHLPDSPEIITPVVKVISHTSLRLHRLQSANKQD